jgi:hypothetical protein
MPMQHPTEENLSISLGQQHFDSFHMIYSNSYQSTITQLVHELEVPALHEGASASRVTRLCSYMQNLACKVPIVLN